MATGGALTTALGLNRLTSVSDANANFVFAEIINFQFIPENESNRRPFGATCCRRSRQLYQHSVNASPGVTEGYYTGRRELQ